jgi:hypothetical protein
VPSLPESLLDRIFVKQLEFVKDIFMFQFSQKSRLTSENVRTISIPGRQLHSRVQLGDKIMKGDYGTRKQKYPALGKKGKVTSTIVLQHLQKRQKKAKLKNKCGSGNNLIIFPYICHTVALHCIYMVRLLSDSAMPVSVFAYYYNSTS